MNFRYESEMIPILVDNLSKIFNTAYITTEFSTGNGVADLVFSTAINDEPLVFDDYGIMSLFITLFKEKRKLNAVSVYENCLDKTRLKRLLEQLHVDDFISYEGEFIIKTRKYKGHTKNLFSVEAKLRDWRSGYFQALRYKFYSHKTYLAYPKEYIHRVDLKLLKESNIGLIAVDTCDIKFILNPKMENPTDLTSYYFLAESFARKFKAIQPA